MGKGTCARTLNEESGTKKYGNVHVDKGTWAGAHGKRHMGKGIAQTNVNKGKWERTREQE